MLRFSWPGWMSGRRSWGRWTGGWTGQGPVSYTHLDVYKRQRYLLGDAEKDAERLEAFLLALHHMDDFITIIRDSKNREEAQPNHSVDMSSWEGSACYPRSTFYPLSDVPSIRKHRITTVSYTHLDVYKRQASATTTTSPNF